MRPFNADFYVTAATLIPVFYLALTLQGNTYRDLMTRWRKIDSETTPKGASDLKFWWLEFRQLWTAFTAFVTLYVITSGLLGEYNALAALANQKATPADQHIVWTGCISLLVAVAIGPVYWFFSAAFVPSVAEIWDYHWNRHIELKILNSGRPLIFTDEGIAYAPEEPEQDPEESADSGPQEAAEDQAT